MAGKTRPSLLHKTLKNVALSNLSLTDKKCIESVFEKYEALSKADVVEVKHGKWIWTENGEADYEQFWICSVCKEKSYIKTKFCSDCGAKMGKGCEQQSG
jgi:hypothetical protein